MSEGTSAALRRRLVDDLHRRGFLTDPRIAEAFLAVPREVFLAEHAQRQGVPAVYQDEAIVVRRDLRTGAPRSSSSQPAIMALMLRMLDVRPGQRVLEIGAGTGYNAALLDRLVGPDGLVITVDVAWDVAAPAAAALAAAGSGARVVVADGRIGLPGPVPFDRIEVTASSDTVPRTWHEALAPGGLLVVPLRLSAATESTHAVAALRRTEEGFASVAITAGGFMPLRPPRPGPEGEGGAGAGLPAISLDAIPGLHIVVRYGEDPPDSRWVVHRQDHWLGITPAGGRRRRG